MIAQHVIAQHVIMQHVITQHVITRQQKVDATIVYISRQNANYT